MKKNKKNKQIQFNRNHLKFIYDDVCFNVNDDKSIDCSVIGWFTSDWPLTQCVVRAFRKNHLVPIDLTEYDEYDGFRTAAFDVINVTVRCESEDKYDDEVGKRIAESKCKAKLFEKAAKICNDIAEETKKECKLLNALSNRYTILKVREGVHGLILDHNQNHSDD